MITPSAGIRSGRSFTVTIDYAGTPQVVTDPDQSIEGWVPTDDGAFVVGEPQGSSAWYPVNDTPRDKATYDFSVSVPAGPDRDGERRARVERDRGRQDDLGLARDRPDGAVPLDGDARALRPDDLQRRGHPVLRRRRPDAREGPGALEAAGDHPVLHLDLRPVPLQRGRRDRRRRQGGRLLARDADEAGLLARARRGDARARDLAHVVRRLGHAHAVAGHLAARGLRDLVRVDLERAHRQQDGRRSSSTTSTTRPPRTRLSGRRRPPIRARRCSSSTGRSTTAAR